MGQNCRTLLQTAAEMRSVGYSWESSGLKVHRKASTCQKWPKRFREQWDPLYRDEDPKIRLRGRPPKSGDYAVPPSHVARIQSDQAACRDGDWSTTVLRNICGRTAAGKFFAGQRSAIRFEGRAEQPRFFNRLPKSRRFP
jgi:hypothetical protein